MRITQIFLIYAVLSVVELRRRASWSDYTIHGSSSPSGVEASGDPEYYSSGSNTYYVAEYPTYQYSSGYYSYSAVDQPRPCDLGGISMDEDGHIRYSQVPEFHEGFDDRVGWLGSTLSILSGYLYLKRSPLSGNVTVAVMLTCAFRFYAGLSKIYDVVCLWTWHCVADQADVFYWGMGLNTIVASLEMSFYYSMHLVLHGLTIDRAILAFFGYKIYQYAKYLILAYYIVVCILPLPLMWMMIGTIADDEMHCWGGFWYDPTYFAITITFYQDNDNRVLFEDLGSWVVLTIAMTLLGFSNLSFFFDELLVGVTSDAYAFGRSDVAANIAKTYRYHASVVVTGILFACYGYSCGDVAPRARKPDITTITSNMVTNSHFIKVSSFAALNLKNRRETHMAKNAEYTNVTVLTTTPALPDLDDYTFIDENFYVATTEWTPLDYATNPPYNFTGIFGDFYQSISYVDWRWYDLLTYDPLVCKKGPGDEQHFASVEDFRVEYKWDGTPFHQDLGPEHMADEPRIAASMFVLGVIGMGLSAASGFLVIKNSKVSKVVRIGMIADASCRFINSLARFYYGKCLLDWGCLKSDGYPFSGIMYNMIWSTLDYTSYLTMGLLQHWISAIRFFAVFDGGMHYRKIEKWSVLYIAILCLLLWLYYMTTIVSEPKTGYLCYTGYHFTPAYYWRTCRYHKSALYRTLFDLVPETLVLIQAITLALDVIALATVRRKMKSRPRQNDLNMRFATMLVATNALIFGKQLVGAATMRVSYRPRSTYLASSVYEFMHCALISCIIITFNMSYLDVKQRNEPTSSSLSTSFQTTTTRV
ncbi:unnamed protein product, partial [Mesorhabditis spiculigera]